VKKAAGALALFALFALPLHSAERETLRTSSGVTVEMAYRSLAPGEPVLFVLKSGPAAGRVSVSFLGTRVDIGPKDGNGVIQAFVGIDLAVEPGIYPLEVSVEAGDRRPETFRKDFEIIGREFPSQNLRIAPEFVTPPRNVQERIRRESEIMGWIYERVTPEWLGDGPFVPPHPAEAWPNFGQRRVVNGAVNSVHTGVDVRVPYGDFIRATNAGRVVLAANFYMPGGTVIIDHGLGIFSFYCHLSRILVRRGSLVGKGGIIGKCGSTGRSTGPHLHWSMRIGQSRVDPYAMLELPIMEIE
jgi:murein DD-endopeptidase MepM/ murein hydrolase activator NlpD